MPVLYPFGHEKQGQFRQATRDVWEGCISYAWVGKWAKAFREGQALLADDPSSGRPPIPDGVNASTSSLKASHINLA
jgi:hypothetical protein